VLEPVVFSASVVSYIIIGIQEVEEERSSARKGRGRHVISQLVQEEEEEFSARRHAGRQRPARKC